MENKIKLHKDVFTKTNSYQPLVINFENRTPSISPFEAWQNPELLLEKTVTEYENAKDIDTDGIPFVESNFLEILVPSLFGAKTHIAPGGLLDVKPIFSDIYETKNIPEIDLMSGEMERALRHIEYLKSNAPSWLYVNPSRFMAPLDYAVVLCGGNFYTELITESELAMAFMEKIANVTILAIKLLKTAAGQPIKQFITPRGYAYPGIRLTGDAIVNLSPTMIEKMMCPLYKKFENEFGRVMLHYCCTPAPSKHVIGSLIYGGGVEVVDNWQGYQTMVPEELFLQNQMGICTDIPKKIILDNNLLNNEFYNVKNRVLACSTTCSTIEEAQHIADMWKKRQSIFS